MAQINRTRRRKLYRNWIEINRGTETRKKQEPEVSHVESRSIHQKLRLIWGSNSLGISFFGTLLLMFLKKMEKEFGDKPKTNNIWYINHSPWTAKIVFDYEKLHLNCIFTLCVNTCMSRFEIKWLSQFNQYYWQRWKQVMRLVNHLQKRLWKRYFKIAFQEVWFSTFWRKTTISIKERGFKKDVLTSPSRSNNACFNEGLIGQCEGAGL